MDKDITINLLKTQSVLSARELILLSRLKLVGIALLIMLLTSGLFVGTAFFAANLRLQGLENDRVTITRRIALQARKEVLLSSLKDRLPAIERVLDNQYPWNEIMSYVGQIAAVPSLTSLTMDDNSVVTLRIEATTLEDIEAMTQKLFQLTQQKKITFPGLSSLSLSKEGGYEVTLYFTPQF